MLKTLRSAVEAVSDDAGWADLGRIGSYIAQQLPEFDSRNYGFARLTDLMEASRIVDMQRPADAQRTVRVRLRKAG